MKPDHEYQTGSQMMNMYVGGLTLRDYFAAKAMQVAGEDYGPAEAAELAYRYADAMLEARNGTR